MNPLLQIPDLLWEIKYGKKIIAGAIESMPKNALHFFACNHLNGYSYKTNRDLHTIDKLSDFDYLKTLPKFLFGKVIAIEVNNSISEQLKFKEYILKILNN